MKIKYLFSKVDKENGFTKLQAKYLKEDIPNNSSIVFIASLFDKYERNDSQLNQLLKIFSNININFKKYFVIDNRTNKTDAIKIIKDSDIIYLMGGSPELQIKSINEYGIKEFIREKDIVLSVSAGSMNQSKRVVYKDEFQNNKIFDYEGLGLVDFNIYPHFDIDNKAFVEENIEINSIIPIISLPNDSFIIVKDNNIEYIGEYYKISKDGVLWKSK